MTRFFVTPEQIAGDVVTLNSDDAHHLGTVLHARAGDKVALLDGTGVEFSAILTTVGKNGATGKIIGSRKIATESRIRITVAQALPKMSDKMEQVLQRCTEVGSAGFIVYAAENGQTHLEGDRQFKRAVRWDTIVKTAAEQAHRAIRPEIQFLPTLSSVLRRSSDHDLTLLADTSAQAPLLRRVVDSLSAAPATILVIIGPESGFTPNELALASAQHAVATSLGPRILRTETAAMAMTAQLLYALDI